MQTDPRHAVGARPVGSRPTSVIPGITIGRRRLATMKVLLPAITLGHPDGLLPSDERTDVRCSGKSHGRSDLPVPAPPVQPGQCDERPVRQAILVITDASSHEVTRLTTGADGSFATQRAVGRYTLTPQPVAGQIGGAPPIDFTVASSGAPPRLDVEHDTGIR
jgi:hypothetical protein